MQPAVDTSSTVAIILGIIIFLFGCIQPAKYEEAKEKGYEVDATIVEVVKKEETDSEGSYTSMSYTVYADCNTGDFIRWVAHQNMSCYNGYQKEIFLGGSAVD